MFCFLVVDEVTGMIWSIYENNKYNIKREVLPIIHHVQHIHPIQFIIFENSV